MKTINSIKLLSILIIIVAVFKTIYNFDYKIFDQNATCFYNDTIDASNKPFLESEITQQIDSIQTIDTTSQSPFLSPQIYDETVKIVDIAIPNETENTPTIDTQEKPILSPAAEMDSTSLAKAKKQNQNYQKSKSKKKK